MSQNTCQFLRRNDSFLLSALCIRFFIMRSMTSTTNSVTSFLILVKLCTFAKRLFSPFKFMEICNLRFPKNNFNFFFQKGKRYRFAIMRFLVPCHLLQKIFKNVQRMMVCMVKKNIRLITLNFWYIVGDMFDCRPNQDNCFPPKKIKMGLRWQKF